MDKAKEQTNHLNNTSGLSAQMIKIHGQTGYHSRNTSETHGHPVQPRKHPMNSFWDIFLKYISLRDNRQSQASWNA
jgi:hypothetical protein